MGSTDKGQRVDRAAAFSWWWVGRNPPCHSQWLQTTLTEVEEKKKSMLKILQDDSDSFVKRAEMYFTKRPDLVEMVEDLCKSYCSLAEKYDQLKSEFVKDGQRRSFSSSNFFNQVQQQLRNCCEKIVENKEIEEEGASASVEDKNADLENETEAEAEAEAETSSTVFKSLNYHYNLGKWSNVEVDTDESVNVQEVNKRTNGVEVFESSNGCAGDDVEVQMLGSEREKKWYEQSWKLWKLVEENLREQEMLIRRNDEKREEIELLYARINTLRDKNRALKRRIADSKVDEKQNQTQMSIFRRLLLAMKFKIN